MNQHARTPTRTPRDPETTRRVLLDAAFDEIHRTGFRAASLDAILAATGVTKGALYHHFGSKQELGYAVVDERIKPLVRERFLQPFREAKDPIEAMQKTWLRMEEQLMKTGILARGCPVNNLIQEMSGVDEGFRRRLAGILTELQDTIADALRSGQSKGLVNPDIDPKVAATFFVAVYLGAVGFAKNALDLVPFSACRHALGAYIKTLRPSPQPQSPTH
jgi:AcrR family transcriptional regulator